ncbi:MAG: peptidylprolyl isomerase [Streptosporangiales bacterium]|nr:peptidylprolyl isomerase [Streptosporangiales bacterium]
MEEHVGSKDRQRRLAREHYERRALRAEERSARRRRRALIGSAAAAALLVTGGVAYAGTRLIGDDGAGKAAGSPSASSTPTATPPPPGTCEFIPDDTAPAEVKKKLPTVKPPKAKVGTAKYRATIETNRGEIVMDLDGAAAPCATGSFRHLAEEGFYDDSSCHRLTATGIFVLQCGDPSGTGLGGPGYRFANENTQGATYPRGTVAMAHSQQPDSNGSQFFIVYKEGGLQPDYTPFGTVVEGLAIVDEVAKAGGGEGGEAPKRDVVVEKVTVKETQGNP